MNWNPGSTTRLSLNTSGSYSDYQSKELNSYNSGFSGDVFANVQQTIPWELRLSLYGGGSTPYVSLQGKGSSFYYYGINLSRSFLKEKRLNISLFASNFSRNTPPTAVKHGQRPSVHGRITAILHADTESASAGGLEN